MTGDFITLNYLRAALWSEYAVVSCVGLVNVVAFRPANLTECELFLVVICSVLYGLYCVSYMITGYHTPCFTDCKVLISQLHSLVP